ncbi:hypothetical protein RI367_006480 [Sorochytrium milnesiophthora]
MLKKLVHCRWSEGVQAMIDADIRHPFCRVAELDWSGIVLPVSSIQKVYLWWFADHYSDDTPHKWDNSEQLPEHIKAWWRSIQKSMTANKTSIITVLFFLSLALVVSAAPTMSSTHRRVILRLEDHKGNSTHLQQMLKSIMDKAATNGPAVQISPASAPGGRSPPRHYQIGGFNAVALDVDDKLEQQLRSLPGVQGVDRQVVWKAFEKELEVKSWGLDRIDGKIDGNFSYPRDGGRGVDIYVIDTGINTQHTEFGGRATFIDLTGEGAVDLAGHGTHVSGTAAGEIFGIAKKAHIIAIKVLRGKDGQGYNTDVLAALALVYQQVIKSGRPSVVNMSLGGARASTSEDSAIRRAIQELLSIGVPVVVAAGNNGADACQTSPAFVPEAITVAASGSETTADRDVLADYSNFGSCVKIIAPGTNIQSAYIGNNDATEFMTGTSMATPHVTGVIASMMSQGVSGDDILEALRQTAAQGVIRGDLHGTQNIFLELRNAPKFLLQWNRAARARTVQSSKNPSIAEQKASSSTSHPPSSRGIRDKSRGG